MFIKKDLRFWKWAIDCSTINYLLVEVYLISGGILFFKLRRRGRLRSSGCGENLCLYEHL